MRRPLCLILLLFLSVRLLLAPALTDDTRWRELEGQTVLLTGKAADLYEPADGSREKMSFTLESVRFITQNQSEQLNGKVICYLEGGRKACRRWEAMWQSEELYRFFGKRLIRENLMQPGTIRSIIISFQSEKPGS